MHQAYFQIHFTYFLIHFSQRFVVLIHKWNYLRTSGGEKQTKYLWDNAATESDNVRKQKRARYVTSGIETWERCRGTSVRVRRNEWTDADADVEFDSDGDSDSDAFSQWLIITHFLLFFLLRKRKCIILWINHFNEHTFSSPQCHNKGGAHFCSSCLFNNSYCAFCCHASADRCVCLSHSMWTLCVCVRVCVWVSKVDGGIYEY